MTIEKITAIRPKPLLAFHPFQALRKFSNVLRQMAGEIEDDIHRLRAETDQSPTD